MFFLSYLLFIKYVHGATRDKINIITRGANQYVLPHTDTHKPQVCLACRIRSPRRTALENGINGTAPTLRVIVGDTVVVNMSLNDSCVVEKTSKARRGRTDDFGPYGWSYKEIEENVNGTCSVDVNKRGEAWRMSLYVCVDEALAVYGEGYPPYCCTDNYDGTVSRNKGRRWRRVGGRVVEKEEDEEHSACKDTNFHRDAFFQYDSHEHSQPPEGMVVPRFGRRTYRPLLGDRDPLVEEEEEPRFLHDLGYSMMCVMNNNSLMVPFTVPPTWPSRVRFPPALLKLRFSGGGGYFGGVGEVSRDLKGPASGFGYNARTDSSPYDMTWQFCDRYLAESSCFVDKVTGPAPLPPNGLDECANFVFLGTAAHFEALPLRYTTPSGSHHRMPYVRRLGGRAPEEGGGLLFNVDRRPLEMLEFPSFFIGGSHVLLSLPEPEDVAPLKMTSIYDVANATEMSRTGLPPLHLMPAVDKVVVGFYADVVVPAIPRFTRMTVMVMHKAFDLGGYEVYGPRLMDRAYAVVRSTVWWRTGKRMRTEAAIMLMDLETTTDPVPGDLPGEDASMTHGPRIHVDEVGDGLAQVAATRFDLDDVMKGYYPLRCPAGKGRVAVLMNNHCKAYSVSAEGTVRRLYQGTNLPCGDEGCAGNNTCQYRWHTFPYNNVRGEEDVVLQSVVIFADPFSPFTRNVHGPGNSVSIFSILVTNLSSFLT